MWVLFIHSIGGCISQWNLKGCCASETHEISQMLLVEKRWRSLRWGMTKLQLENFLVVLVMFRNPPGIVERVVHKSFKTWVTLFALRGIWRRVVFRFRIYDCWSLTSSLEVLSRAVDLAYDHSAANWIGTQSGVDLLKHICEELKQWGSECMAMKKQ